MTHEEFKARYLPLSEGLFRIAFHYLEDSSDAQDTVQDLYIKLWNSRDKLDTVLNPQAYAYTLLRNLCIDRLRKNGRTVSMGECPESSGNDPPDKELADRETLRKALRCIEDLPPKQREIIRMRIFEELEYEEIAEKLGLSEINTRVQLSLARKALKNKMKYEL
ncbi:MAG: RNA polymerase sigma factor [Bacteroidales bacterium]|nr:RNA polymerase sigma factor [Bacteroidales bacterium]MBR4817981.1 RNA polymerase sigma factor [Bacteroidales bacterium]MBR5055147.1 RNA polymerase sigma factor [Bacteroidales bacterium]